jgi:hypothetical protein
VVTLVDAKHLEMHIEDSKEAREQVAFADVLVLNKTDLVPEAAVDALERKVRGMNAMAQIFRSRMADIPIARVLDIGGFDLDRALEHKPAFLEPEYPFEWSALLETDGDLRLVVDEGPDATMSVVVVPLDSGNGDAVAALASCGDRVLRLFFPARGIRGAGGEHRDRRAALHPGPGRQRSEDLHHPGARPWAICPVHRAHGRGVRPAPAGSRRQGAPSHLREGLRRWARTTTPSHRWASSSRGRSTPTGSTAGWASCCASGVPTSSAPKES